MIRFFKGLKRAADFFNVNPDGISFKDEQRVKSLESTVKFFSKEFIESSGNRYDLKFIKLEEAIFELKKNIWYLDSELYTLKPLKQRELPIEPTTDSPQNKDKVQKPSQLALPLNQAKTSRKPKAVRLKPVEEEVKKVKSKLTQSMVKRLFEYRDGNLYWKINNRPAKKGSLAGSINTSDGYSYGQVSYKGTGYSIARVIFLMFHGYMPECVTYRDKNTLNTRIENLMEANRSQISARSTVRKDNTTGYKGVKYDPRLNLYIANIVKNGKSYYLGGFSNPKEAYKAYCKASKKLYGEFSQIA